MCSARPAAVVSSMSDPFQISLPGLHGPTSDLLEHVEHHQLAAEEVSLEAITQQFILYLEGQPAIDLESAGEFMRTIARLMLLKSEILLPQHAVEQETAPRSVDTLPRIDFEPIRRVAAFMQAREGRESFAGAPPILPIERKIEPRSPSVLNRAWEDMQKRNGLEPVHVVAPSFVRLEVALSKLIRSLRSARRMSLARVLRGVSRYDAVVHFLAALELVHRGEAVAVQTRLFDDITLERQEAETDAGSRAG